MKGRASDAGAGFRCRAWPLLSVLGLTMFGLPSSASSLEAADRPLRVVLAPPIEPSIVERILGQTSDLTPRLEVIAAPAESEPDESLDVIRRALSFARTLRADVAVALVEGDDAMTIYVVDVAEERLFARRIERPPSDDRLARSASEEAISLVVRSALSGLLEGGEIGVSLRPPPVPEAPAAIAPQPPEPPPAAERTIRLDAHFGWSASFDGVAPLGHHGPELRLSLGVARLEVALRGAVGLPVTLDDGRTVLQLFRHAASASLAWVLAHGLRARVLAGVVTGAVLVHRTTTVRDSSLLGTAPAITPLAFVGPELRGQWFPGRAAPRVGFELAVGLDLVPGGLTLTYADGESTVRRDALRAVQPRVSLSLIVGSAP